METVEEITVLKVDHLTKGATPTMKAIVCTKFGSPDVLELKEIEKPQPKGKEVLIRNYASSMNTVDIVYRSSNDLIINLVILN